MSDRWPILGGTGRSEQWVEHWQDGQVPNRTQPGLPKEDVQKYGESMHWEGGSKALAHSAIEALDRHLDYFDWLRSFGHRKYMHGYHQAYEGSVEVQKMFQGQFAEKVEAEVEYEYDMINKALTYWVNGEISSQIAQASEMLDPITLYESILPSDFGIAYFEHAFSYDDFKFEFDGADRWEWISIIALAWRPGLVWVHNIPMPGIRLYMYTNSAVFPQWPSDWGSKPDMVLIDHSGWAFGTPWSAGVKPDPDNGIVAEHMSHIRKFAAAFWLFMEQEIVVQEQPHVPRPTRRRLVRSGRDMPEDGAVVNVHLRRRVKEGDSGEIGQEHDGDRHRDYSHRFWVRGHWRYNRRTQQKDIYVHPYIKGPEDKELVLKNKIISVDR